jgi:hypothetical protein
MKGSEHPPIFNQFYLIIESLFLKKKFNKEKKNKKTWHNSIKYKKPKDKTKDPESKNKIKT